MALISTNVGGIKDRLKNDINGIFLDEIPPKADHISDSVKRLIIDGNLFKKICKKNFLEAKEVYDIPIVVRELEEIYSAI